MPAPRSSPSHGRARHSGIPLCGERLQRRHEAREIACDSGGVRRVDLEVPVREGGRFAAGSRPCQLDPHDVRVSIEKLGHAPLDVHGRQACPTA